MSNLDKGFQVIKGPFDLREFTVKVDVVPSKHPDDLIDAVVTALRNTGNAAISVTLQKKWEADTNEREKWTNNEPSEIRGRVEHTTIIDDPADVDGWLNIMRRRLPARIGRRRWRNHGVGMKWLAQREREIGKFVPPDVTVQPHEPWRPYD